MRRGGGRVVGAVGPGRFGDYGSTYLEERDTTEQLGVVLGGDLRRRVEAGVLQHSAGLLIGLKVSAR